jgi:hypothetical protein
MSTRGVFFGWWVALSFAVMAFVASGIRFAVGPFLKPMVVDLGLDRAVPTALRSPPTRCTARTSEA